MLRGLGICSTLASSTVWVTAVQNTSNELAGGKRADTAVAPSVRAVVSEQHGSTVT